MIAFLNGTLAGKTSQEACIEVGGVGFAVAMGATALSRLPEVGQPVQVQTYLYVRDDAMQLYGFLTLEEKALFEQLIGVSKVGPKIALAALSFYEPRVLADAIAAGDVTCIAKVPGIGKKMAERIILELKGTLAADGGLLSLLSAQPARSTAGDAGADARKGAADALLSMGFTSAEADVALSGAPEDADEGALLKYALKRLGANAGFNG